MLFAVGFGTFTEGQKSEGHRMAGNVESMNLWAKFSSEGIESGRGTLDDGLPAYLKFVYFFAS